MWHWWRSGPACAAWRTRCAACTTTGCGSTTAGRSTARCRRSSTASDGWRMTWTASATTTTTIAAAAAAIGWRFSSNGTAGAGTSTAYCARASGGYAATWRRTIVGQRPTALLCKRFGRVCDNYEYNVARVHSLSVCYVIDESFGLDAWFFSLLSVLLVRDLRQSNEMFRSTCSTRPLVCAQAVGLRPHPQFICALSAIPRPFKFSIVLPTYALRRLRVFHVSQRRLCPAGAKC